MMHRRELLRITILGASVILGGCGELSQKQIKAQKTPTPSGERSARRATEAAEEGQERMGRRFPSKEPFTE